MQKLFSQELRFKDEQGNEFPGWEEKRLAELVSTMKSGIGITSSNIFNAGTYPVYGGNGLRGYTEEYTHEGEYLLIGRQGALCGNINRVSGQVFISEHAIATQGNKYSDTDWLVHKLQFMNLNRLSESSAQPGLSVKKLKRLKIKSPLKPEQRKIAAFLSSIDKKITLISTELNHAQSFKKSLLQQMFI
ncbi:MAG: restriction endonuclease subunit S [Candidatus Electrothrix sp. ATG1]|nr:restriction endonuclease subunit S [Candidatus Electrothrix sp. ATG1]